MAKSDLQEPKELGRNQMSLQDFDSNTPPLPVSLLGDLRHRSQILAGVHSPHAELGTAKPAVVFAPLVLPDWEASIQDAKFLFIKRSSHLRRHAGQVGFPGGVIEKEDKNLLETGFRESHEEVGLSREAVEVLCPLSPRAVPSGFHLYPFFVATVQRDFVLQESEVESLHLVPVRELLSCPFRAEQKEWRDTQYRVVYFDLDGLCIWGITGRILEVVLETFFDWKPTVIE